MTGFAKATKRQQKLRLAITGPSGSGKTYTALTIGRHLGTTLAVIDTERGSASKYAGDVADFDTQELRSFEVPRYLRAIGEAASSGYEVLVIDSLSHAWSGKGGILEEADKRGGKFQAWKELTPIQQGLVDAILDYPGHVIVTMRSKMTYQVSTEEKNGRKETKVEKLGLAPIQRDDMSYEFDVVLDMDERNNARVSKTRCAALTGQVIAHPGAEVAETLRGWLDDGAPPPLDVIGLGQCKKKGALIPWSKRNRAAIDALEGQARDDALALVRDRVEALGGDWATFASAYLGVDESAPDAPDAEGFAGALEQDQVSEEFSEFARERVAEHQRDERRYADEAGQ